MKNIIFITSFLCTSLLNCMENANVVGSFPVLSQFEYLKIKYRGTKICVAKGKVLQADGMVDVIVGREDLFKNKHPQISLGIIVDSTCRYGRYGFDYTHWRHQEGVIYTDPDEVVDAQKHPQEVKNIVYTEQMGILSEIKKNHLT